MQLVLVAAAALVFYIGLALWADAGELRAAWERVPVDSIPRVLVLVVVGLLLRAARWQYYTDALALGLPRGPNLVAFLASFSFTASPGKVGEIVKSLLLERRYGSRISQTAGILLVERVTDVLAVGVLSLGGLAVRGVGRLGLVAGALGFAAVVFGSSSPALHRIVVRLMSRTPVISRWSQTVDDLLVGSRRLLHPRPLGVGLGLALLAWSCEALALHEILSSLVGEANLRDSFFAFGTSTLMGVVSMLPGGLGGFEATMLVVLQRVGISRADALAATLVLRLSTLWMVTALGAVFLGLWFLLFRDRVSRLARR